VTADHDTAADTPPVLQQGAFEVRPGRRADTRSFLEMWREVVDERRYVRTESVQHSPRYYRRKFFKNGWTDQEASIVAVSAGRVIGHISVSREESLVTRHVASIGMAVAKDWRGRGVGTALMAECIRWARLMSVEKLVLSTYPDNERALALYRKFGFQEEGRLTGHSKKSIGYRDEILMGLWVRDRPPEGSR
jgi:RimJ/RimL family protein N-acetyltransferase